MTGVASSAGLSSGEGVGDSASDGDALGLGSGVGELFFFFPFGDADAEAELSLLGVGDGSSSDSELDFDVAFFTDALGSGEGLRFGVAEGEADGFGLAVGDWVGEGVGFFDVELFRLFGEGVGVGSKMLLILSPNDSSARADTGVIAASRSKAARIIVGRFFETHPIRGV